MGAKKWSATQNVIWGDRTLQAAEFGDEQTPHETPDANDPEYNELVDDAVLQSRTTDQELSGRLTGKYGVAEGLKVRGPTTGRWNIARAFNAGGEVLDIMAIDDSDGPNSSLWRKAAASSLMNYSTHTIDSSSFGLPGAVTGGFGHATAARLAGQMSFHPSYASVNIGLQSYFDAVTNKTMGFHEKNNSLVAFGIPAPNRILEGTGATSALFSPELTTYTTGNAAGNRAGVQSSTFNIFRGFLSSNKWFGCKFMISVSTLIRIWIGLSSANIGSIDNPAASGIEFFGLRYSTDAGDTTLQAVSSDGATLITESIGGAILTSATYYLFIQANKNGSEARIVLFKNTTGFEAAIADVPGSAGNLGFQVSAETRTAASKTFRLSHVRIVEE